MLINRTRKTETPEPVIDLSARLAQLRADIEDTRRELVTARDTADAMNTEAILHGGHFDPTLQGKAEQLSVRLSHLENELGPLARAAQQQRAEADRQAADAEDRRVEEIKGRYRAELGSMVTSLLAAIEAREKSKRIFLELPYRATNELQLPTADVNIPQVVESWKKAVITQGYGDLLPQDDPAIAAFASEKQQDAEWNARWIARQRAERGSAIGAIEPEAGVSQPMIADGGRGRRSLGHGALAS